MQCRRVTAEVEQKEKNTSAAFRGQQQERAKRNPREAKEWAALLGRHVPTIRQQQPTAGSGRGRNRCSGGHTRTVPHVRNFQFAALRVAEVLRAAEMVEGVGNDIQN